MAIASARAGKPAVLRTLATHSPAALWSSAGSRIEPAHALLGEFAAFAGLRRLAAAGALVLAGAALEGVGILLIVPLLGPVLEGGAAGGLAVGGPWDSLLQPLGPAAQSALLIAGFALLLALRAAILVGRETTTARLQHGYVEALKLRLLRRLSGASWGDVMAIERARLVKALGGDMLQIAFAVHYAIQAAVGILMLAAFCLFAAFLSPALSLVTLVLAMSVAVAGALFVRQARAGGEDQLRQNLRMAESSARFLTGLKLAKAQDLQEGFLDSYAGASRAHLRGRVGFVRQVSASRQLITLFGALAAAAAMIVGAALTDASTVTMIAFFVLLSRTVGPAALVLQGVQQIAHGLPIFDELRSLDAALGRPPDAKPVCETSGVPAIPRSIALESVSLAYPAAEGELPGGVDGVTLTIRPGEFVGISGPSGAGKTTLLDVIALIATPDSGRVALGAAEADAIDVANHRRRLTYLGAEPVLFADTIRENLAWAAPGVADDEMWSALRKAGAEGLVHRLGHGLDSKLSEAGSNLSAGERQRIACARAFLRRPGLWLLDEATGSLDLASEQQLVGHILDEEPRPIVLFVTHRAESLALCDRVITLAEGRLVGDQPRRPHGSPALAAERLRA